MIRLRTAMSKRSKLSTVMIRKIMLEFVRSWLSARGTVSGQLQTRGLVRRQLYTREHARKPFYTRGHVRRRLYMRGPDRRNMIGEKPRPVVGGDCPYQLSMQVV